MCKNVMIPLFLLKKIAEFLDNLDFPGYHDLFYEYDDILWALKVKIQKLELQGAYSKIIQFDDEEKSDLLRNKSRYLQQRYQLNDTEADDIF